MFGVLLGGRRGAKKLCGNHGTILRSHCEVEVGHHAIEDKDGRAQAVVVFEQPAARMARQLRHEAKTDEVLRASVQQGVALR